MSLRTFKIYRYDPEREIVITSGDTDNLLDVLLATTDPGDEVIVFTPVYDSYGPAIELQGGKVVYATLTQPGYRPDWAQVKADLRRSRAGHLPLV